MSKQRLLPVSLLVLSALSAPSFSDEAKPKLFTELQAARGKIAVTTACALCHLPNLHGRVGAPDESPDEDTLPASYRKFLAKGTGYVPPLAGDEFMAKWKGKSVAELADQLGGAMKSFPPSGMDETTALAVTAYVLKLNGASAGPTELTSPPNLPVAAVVESQKGEAAH